MHPLSLLFFLHLAVWKMVVMASIPATILDHEDKGENYFLGMVE